MTVTDTTTTEQRIDAIEADMAEVVATMRDKIGVQPMEHHTPHGVVHDPSLDLLNCKDRLTAVAVELSNLRGLVECEEKFGRIDHGHARDGILSFLEVATRNVLDGLGGVLYAIEHDHVRTEQDPF